MNILAVECSAGPVSAAVSVDDIIVSSAFSNINVTHSETLLPMVEKVLSSAKLTLNDIDAFAVSNGPGSFTGIRIGIAAIKGMAAADNSPCIPVSTLFAMAKRFVGTNATICPVMDARRNQVYNALFKAGNDGILRLCEDRAISADFLAKELKEIKGDIIICGDGANVIEPYLKDIDNAHFAPKELLYQNATGVLLCAMDKVKLGETIKPEQLLPSYLRLPQAERELREKLKKD